VVTPQQIADDDIDLNVPPDGAGDTWGTIERGAGLPLAKVQHDYLDHATQENYDNWYNGQLGREEGLRDKRFEIRPGVALSAARKFGTVGVDGVSASTWNLISGLAAAGPLGRLPRGTAFASVFQTAFHNQANNDLSKFSTGAYIYPDTSAQTLAPFAKHAQSQFRTAAVYARLAAWYSQAEQGAYVGAPQREQSDVDQDGEDEYLLFNDRLFAVFERIGGRMTGAWVRDLETHQLHQCVGNPLSYAGSETELEGVNNTIGAAVDAFRVSAFRDQFYLPAQGSGTTAHVNALYTVAPAPSGGGWRFTAADGTFFKEASIPASSPHDVQVIYSIQSGQLFVRSGLSPNLEDLLLNGQKHLALPPAQTAFTGPNAGFHVVNRTPGGAVRASMLIGSTNAFWNPAAVDRDTGAVFDTINMRNLAQTQQVEFRNISAAIMRLRLEAGTAITLDGDGDDLPDGWELTYGLDITTPNGVNGASGDRDGDGMSNLQEYVFGGSPLNPGDGFLIRVDVTQSSPGTRTLTFASRAGRTYQVEYTNALGANWTVARSFVGNGSPIVWTDDGTNTGTPPDAQTKRFYRIRATVNP
jgi:hypothetical protein